MIKNVPLDQIRIDGDTQSRAGINMFVVQDYTDDMNAGVAFPPGNAVFDGVCYWLWDGFHRYHAEKKRGSDTMKLDYSEGTVEDARWLAVGANKEQDRAGMRRTNFDKRRAVENALKLKPKMSDRAIAEYCGVSHTLVSAARKETSGNGCQMPERTAERGGKTYTINTANIGKKTSSPPAQSSAQSFFPADEPTEEPSYMPDNATSFDSNESIPEESSPVSEPTPAPSTPRTPLATVPESAPNYITLEAWNAMKPTARKKLLADPPGSTSFNAQKNDNIEWALWSWNPVTGCLHNCPYCLDPRTLVVYLDGSRRPIGDVQVGDVLRGFTETVSAGDYRQNEEAVVEIIFRTRQSVWEIITNHGTIRATASHRWLVAAGYPFGSIMRTEGRFDCSSNSLSWMETRHLSPGQFLLWWDERFINHVDLALPGNPFVAEPIRILHVQQTDDIAEMIEIQTSSRTFLAEGFATHNCYARDIATSGPTTHAFPNGFAPTLIPSRLKAPHNTTFPQKAIDAEPSGSSRRLGLQNVFVSSMADLFGRWVPSEWIEAVLAEIRAAPQWNFLFLTKFPIRMADFVFPDNAWVGTTVDCQARVVNAEKAFRKVKAGVKWLSIEPMIERLTFSDLAAFQWIVLGGSSRSSQTPEWHPPREWILEIEKLAKKLGVSFYEKSNLHGRIRGYPAAPVWREPDQAPDSLRYLPTPEAHAS